MADVILIVDDEDSVRKTFYEWLTSANLGCEIVAASDAETALTIANQKAIDLAILDWNLGAGHDGLQLLEDLYVFHPDVVAILITGYAHQATPLDAMRMGVRDYLDKNQDLRRETFLAAVQKQLARLRPAKRERALQRSLVQFRDSVAKVLPLVQTASVLNDPVPFSASVRALFRFLQRTTKATSGVLLVRSYDTHRVPPEEWRAYDVEGQPLEVQLVPFQQSLAGAVAGMQEASVIADLPQKLTGSGTALQPFERGRQHVLAAPLTLGSGLLVVVELFDKEQGQPFNDEDRRLVSAALPLGAELLRHALADRQDQATLATAVQAALDASNQVAATLTQPAGHDLPSTVLTQVRSQLDRAPLQVMEAPEALRVAELVREIATRHGPHALKHCITLLETVAKMLQGESS